MLIAEWTRFLEQLETKTSSVNGVPTHLEHTFWDFLVVECLLFRIGYFNKRKLTLNLFFQLICLSLCNSGERNADIFQREHATKTTGFWILIWRIYLTNEIWEQKTYLSSAWPKQREKNWSRLKNIAIFLTEWTKLSEVNLDFPAKLIFGPDVTSIFVGWLWYKNVAGATECSPPPLTFPWTYLDVDNFIRG